MLIQRAIKSMVASALFACGISFGYVSNAYADLSSWIFGYKSYEDCILGEIDKGTSDHAAKLVANACRRKFSQSTKQEKNYRSIGLVNVAETWWSDDEFERKFRMKVINDSGNTIQAQNFFVDSTIGDGEDCSYEERVVFASKREKMRDGDAAVFGFPSASLTDKIPSDHQRFCVWVEGFSLSH